MSKKKKSKKQKSPNIPVQTLARPRLEQLMTRLQAGQLSSDDFVTSIKQLMADAGQEAVLNGLVGLLDKASNEQRDALLLVIPKLGNKATIQHLWQLVRHSKMSIASKMTALVILQQMGEEVNLEEPGEYFSWRDIKQGSIEEVKSLGRYSLRALIKEIQRQQTTDDLEAMMLHMQEITGQTGGEVLWLGQVTDLIAMADTGAADMLATIAATTSYQAVREAAQKGLARLADQRIYPQSEVVKALQNEHFYAAYTTDPANPWQQGVIMLWERAKNDLQGIVFLLDFGHPWKGAIKDMFVTHAMTPQQVKSQFLTRLAGDDAEYRRTTYARARKFILEAVAANQRNRVKLPPEYQQFRALIERRIMSPSAEALAYAAQVDADTADEWGELKGKPLRGIQIVDMKGGGESIPVVIGDLSDEDWDEFDDDEAFDDLLAEIKEYYAESNEDAGPGQAAEILPYDWAAGYLSTRYEAGLDVDELDDRWHNLADFMYYLDNDDEAPTALVELQAAQLSHFVADFWDEEIELDASFEEKQHALQTIHDLYAYLAERKFIPAKAVKSVAQAVDRLLSQPGRLTPILE